MPRSLDLIVRQKLSHLVAEKLTKAIESGKFAPGTQLPSERDLMTLLGVGRPAVREAMQALAQQGLIRIAHGERARVVVPTPDSVLDGISSAMVALLGAYPAGLDNLKEARTLFEIGLARIAAERATKEDKSRLQATLAACRKARGSGEPFVAADMAFHRQIAAMSGNPLIAAVSGAMLEWLMRFKRDMVSVRGADRLTINEHARIADAIARHDPAGAAEAMTEHLARANALYAILSCPSAPPHAPPPD